MDGLTPKQAAFVREYLIDLNATQAALRAGYSPKTAFRIGAENLQKPAIQSAIKAAMDARAERTEVDADKVLKTIERIAYADPRDLLDGTRLKSPEEWPDDIAMAIAGFEMTTTKKGEGVVEHVTKVKWSDRRGYLDMLMKHTGKYERDNTQKAPVIQITKDEVTL